jgi:hypothetical protein
MRVVEVIISKQCVNCSFDIVATQFYNWIKTRSKDIVLQKIGCNGDIEFIDINLWWTQCRNIDNEESPRSIIRGDSPYQYIKDVDEKEDHLLITTSNYNAKLFSKLFKRVEVVPHPYDPEEIKVVDNVKGKKYDVITIGYNTADDHKGLRIARKVAKELGLKYVEISNECNGEDWCYKFMSLSRNEVYKLIAQSRFYLALSHTEGFGLPVLESMVAGTIPIFVNGHAFSEYAKGIPIPAYKKREDWFEYEYEDVIEAVKYATKMSEKEYKELSEKIKSEAREKFKQEKIYEVISYLIRSSYHLS